jgi:hypothetical protein
MQGLPISPLLKVVSASRCECAGLSHATTLLGLSVAFGFAVWLVQPI